MDSQIVTEKEIEAIGFQTINEALEENPSAEAKLIINVVRKMVQKLERGMKWQTEECSRRESSTVEDF